jgi:uncharacterized protein with von Willebrand factor type A (vWA) domain
MEGSAIRRRLAGFLRTLRDNGFQIGLAESRDALRILAAPPFRRAAAVKPALRALCCGGRADWLAFDDLFDAFWTGRGVKTRVAVNRAGAQASQRTMRSLAETAGASQGSAGAGDAVPQGRREGASRHESLAHTDFRHLADPEAMARAHDLAERLARTMRARLSRRQQRHRRGRRLDLRATIRASLSTGGLPLDLVQRRRRRPPLRLIVLLDASGSMSLYTSVFLRFVHGILDHFREAEAFLFHTRLVHVSAALREKDAARALDRLGLMAEGVGGGTRIGEALADFNRHHAARVINSRSCVMILSDGYDTGAPERLGAEMAALRRRCRRIVWLNPLLGWKGYEPVARGMATALPHVDLFAAAHDLASLGALEPYLARL